MSADLLNTNSLSKVAMGALQALEESESRFNDIADRIEQGLWVRSADGKKCLYLNPAFNRIWGRTLDEMNDVTWGETLHPEDRDRAYQYYLQKQSSNKDYTQSYRIVRPDGEIRWIENQGYSVLDNDGNLLRMSGIARDVTEQKRMDEELRLAQKLESIGKLSAGIAHEVNTPCQYVSDNLTFMGESVDSLKEVLKELPALFELAIQGGVNKVEVDRIQKIYAGTDIAYLIDEIPTALDQSKSGMEQIKRIVESMKGFSHPGKEKIATDINKVILDTSIITKSEWKYIAELSIDLDEELPSVKVIPSALTQVLLNIIINAAHAIADTLKDDQLGVISIKTLVEMNSVIIKISDNGSGIPEHVVEHIFDPFYTTKEPGKGSGQGLSIVHKIICEGHNGSISVDSTVGVGTCFSIRLPIDGLVE